MSTPTKERRPAIEGWFTLDDVAPQLLGSRCTTCGTVLFPRNVLACPNPHCDGTEFEEAPLSRRGTVWSLTENHYAPPAPYMAPDPFVPYTVVAVELAEERMVVLGQLADGFGPADLRVGDEVELVLGPLYEDDEATYVVWKWQPVRAA
jgi:uncharacterized OB-fold protein